MASEERAVSDRLGSPPVEGKYLFRTDPASLTKYEKTIVDTVVGKYGERVRSLAGEDGVQKILKTARAVFYGPKLVFDAITKVYRIDAILKAAFSEEIAPEILSMRKTPREN
jgi:hypothetical protein